MDTAKPDEVTVDTPEIVSPPADETVAAPEVTPEVEPSEKPAVREFKPIASQDELDAIVQKRLARERGKRERAEADADAFRRMALEKPVAEAPKPVADEAPKQADYVDHHEFIRDTARYEARQEAKKTADEISKRMTEDRQREHQSVLARSHEERQNKAREEYDDYDDVALDSTLPITPVMANVIQRSEVGPKLAYYLGKNPAEAARIAKLDPYLQPMELGLLMAKLPKAPAKATVSQAPEPIEPVSKGGSSSSSIASDKDNVETWLKKEKERLKKAGKKF